MQHALAGAPSDTQREKDFRTYESLWTGALPKPRGSERSHVPRQSEDDVDSVCRVARCAPEEARNFLRRARSFEWIRPDGRGVLSLLKPPDAIRKELDRRSSDRPAPESGDRPGENSLASGLFRRRLCKSMKDDGTVTDPFKPLTGQGMHPDVATEFVNALVTYGLLEWVNGTDHRHGCKILKPKDNCPEVTVKEFIRRVNAGETFEPDVSTVRSEVLRRTPTPASAVSPETAPLQQLTPELRASLIFLWESRSKTTTKFDGRPTIESAARVLFKGTVLKEDEAAQHVTTLVELGHLETHYIPGGGKSKRTVHVFLIDPTTHELTTHVLAPAPPHSVEGARLELELEALKRRISGKRDELATAQATVEQLENELRRLQAQSQTLARRIRQQAS
jgi:hypothetical protein